MNNRLEEMFFFAVILFLARTVIAFASLVFWAVFTGIMLIGDALINAYQNYKDSDRD